MKYNKSEIMKRAWEIKRNLTYKTFSACLVRAWSEAKKTAEENAYVGAKFESGMTVTMLDVTRTLNRWTKNGMDRVYINNGRKSDGYVDLVARKSVGGNSYTYYSMIVNAILSMQF